MMRSITSFGRRVTGDSASQRKWLMLRLVMLLFTAMTTSATWADTETITLNSSTKGNGTNFSISYDANAAFSSERLEIAKEGKTCNLTVKANSEGIYIKKIGFTFDGKKKIPANFTDGTNKITVNTTGDNAIAEWTTDATNITSKTFEITTGATERTDIVSITVEYTTSWVEMNAVFSSPSVTAEVNGTAEWPKLTVKAGETDLKEGTDYSVAYSTDNPTIVNTTDKTISTTTAGEANVTATITSLKTEYTKPATNPTFSVTVNPAADPETPSGPTIFDFTKGTDPGTAKDGITIGGGSYSSGGHYDFAKGDKLTLSSDKTITKVVITYTEKKDDRTGGLSSVTANVGNYSYDGNVTGTWVGTSKDIVISFTDKARIP